MNRNLKNAVMQAAKQCRNSMPPDLFAEMEPVCRALGKMALSTGTPDDTIFTAMATLVGIGLILEDQERHSSS